MEEKSTGKDTNNSRLIKLLRNSYNITPVNITKESDTSFIINTESECLVLHRYGHKHELWLRVLYIQAYLKDKGFPYAPDIVKCTIGASYVKHSHSLYYIDKKADNVDSSIDCLLDYKNACYTLGAFHSYAAGLVYKDYPLRDHIKRLSPKTQDKITLALSIRNIIDRKRLFTDFDSSYISTIDALINRLELCRELSLGYESLCEEARQKPYICHNNFIKSISKKESGELYINSFTTCSINAPVYELSELLKSIMSLDEYNWDFYTLKDLIEAYNSSRPLSHYEYEVLLCMIIMPDKLLNLGKKRYIKQKNWSEKKYAQKLNKALLQFNKQQIFSEHFIDAYRLLPDKRKL